MTSTCMCSRRLDAKHERWLRFEIELACSELKTGAAKDQQIEKELGLTEVLNLALYDQADPDNLYLASVDREKFEKL